MDVIPDHMKVCHAFFEPHKIHGKVLERNDE